MHKISRSNPSKLVYICVPVLGHSALQNEAKYLPEEDVDDGSVAGNPNFLVAVSSCSISCRPTFQTHIPPPNSPAYPATIGTWLHRNSGGTVSATASSLPSLRVPGLHQNSGATGSVLASFLPSLKGLFIAGTKFP